MSFAQPLPPFVSAGMMKSLTASGKSNAFFHAHWPRSRCHQSNATSKPLSK